MKEVITLAGGCFWCLEAVFEQLKGVEKVESGYSGGVSTDPTYDSVSSGTTGHAEAVQITFDPEIISFRDLLKVFFSFHDPTTLNRQGRDVGPQYRSAVFYRDAGQLRAVVEVIAELEADNIWGQPVVTEVEPFKAFYPAEEYHRQFYQRRPDQPYCRAIVAPKVAKLRREYADKLKK